MPSRRRRHPEPGGLKPIVGPGRACHARLFPDAGTSVGVVTSQEIANYNVQDLRQSFELLGKRAWRFPPRGNSGFVVRGVSSEGLTQPTRSAPIVAVVIDVRFSEWRGTRRGARGVWDVEQIEVLRAAVDAAGQHALGGAVLIKTKDPTYTPEAIIEAQGGSDRCRIAVMRRSCPTRWRSGCPVRSCARPGHQLPTVGGAARAGRARAGPRQLL